MSDIAQLEALLFVAGDEGLALEVLAELTEKNMDDLQTTLEELRTHYEADSDRGLTLIETAKVYQMVTKKDYAKSVKEYAQSPYSQTLSRALLETLAIIAYRQPITRIEIEDIRGVQVTGNLQKLRVRQLIKEVGQLNKPGNPLLYGTTDFFLDYFGINSLEELPELIVGNDDNEITDLFFKNQQEQTER